MNTATEYFGEPISVYTRAQAIEDGVLIDVSDTDADIAREAGFKIPVAMTRAAWDDCVAWDDNDSRRQTYQDLSGRLWDVLYMGSLAGRAQPDAASILYSLYRVPHGGRGIKARRVSLRMVVGPGDSGEAVITIMMPHES